jgi:uncharacterized protein YraI
MRRLFLLSIFLMLFYSMAFAQSQGRTMFVAVNSAEVRSSTGFFSSTVGTLALGSTVTVIRESGRWMEVRAETISGWVAAASLTTRRITGQGRSATAGEIALAGKGFSSEVETEYQRDGYNQNFYAVYLIEAQTVPRNELLQFIADGRLFRGE